MISVCMATHNGELYIRQQLTSIIDQLGLDDELVISDDSSTDATLDIISSIADPRIHLLAGNQFFSPIYNFENALQHSNGEIIVLADQDDVWLEDKLPLVRRKLAGKTDRPSLLMTNAYIIDGDGLPAGQSLFDRKPPKASLLANLYDNTFTGCALAFTRPLLDLALPFPPGIPMHDSWLGLLALRFGEVEFDATRTMEYRRHGTNVSRTQRNPLRQIRWRLCLAWHLARRKGLAPIRK